MRAILPLTLAAGSAALAAAWLPPTPRAAVWGLLGASYLAVCVWGTLCLGSGVFTRAWTRAPRATAEVALTFDDGPDPESTPPLLDLLAARGVAACFFLVGERARAHPDLVRRLVAEGHLVGNHSDRHSWATNFYGGRRMRREIEACQRTLLDLTGAPPRFYRPPMGLANHALDGATRALGLTLVGWQVRGLDTARRPAAAVVARVLRGVRPGGIILLHDGGQDPQRLVQIVGDVLDGLTARGLSPVRLDRLPAAALPPAS